MSRLTIACAAALLAGCVSAGTWPRIIAVHEVTAAPTLRGEWIESYDDALASIVAIMSRDLALPPVQASVYFHQNRDAFQAALVADGYDPQLARDTAETLSAVSGYRRVLVNDESIAGLGWPIRVALLAHELTHTVQYDLAGGSRGTSEQWLREGFAEWVEVEVLVRLGFTTRPQARRVVLNRLRDVGPRRLPALSEMVTFPDWVAVVQRSNQEAVYGHAMLATQLLLDRVGVPAALKYFELFGESQDRVVNFQRAFGQDLASFESEFNARLAAELR